MHTIRYTDSIETINSLIGTPVTIYGDAKERITRLIKVGEDSQKYAFAASSLPYFKCLPDSPIICTDPSEAPAIATLLYNRVLRVASKLTAGDVEDLKALLLIEENKRLQMISLVDIESEYPNVLARVRENISFVIQSVGMRVTKKVMDNLMNEVMGVVTKTIKGN